MRSVLQAALDLSTSTKPFDSVTAAHLLNLLLHRPDLSQALLPCAQAQGLDFQPSSPPFQASESLILEHNTLAGEIQMYSWNKWIYVLNIYWIDCNVLNTCLELSVLSGSVLAALPAVRGVEGWIFSLTSSCFLPSVWQSSLHHSCTAAPKRWVRIETAYTHLFHFLFFCCWQWSTAYCINWVQQHIWFK